MNKDMICLNDDRVTVSSNLRVMNIVIRQQLYNFFPSVDFCGVIVRSVNRQYVRIFEKLWK